MTDPTDNDNNIDNDIGDDLVNDDESPDLGSYSEAIDELEELLDELEGADVDVDVLAARVARGVELIRFCRARLEVVAEDVDSVVTDLISVDGGTQPVSTADSRDDD